MKLNLEALENNIKIYQDKDNFNFGVDSARLAHFVLENLGIDGKNIKNICDLCSGAIPIPLLMYAHKNEYLSPDVHFTTIEIDKDQVEVSKKSLEYNKCEKYFTVINADIKEYEFLNESFDLVTCNPPYNKVGSAVINKDDRKLIAKHEIYINLDDICRVASKILKSNKKFFLVHHSDRTTEIIRTLQDHNLEPKKLRFIYTKEDKNSSLVLIESVKNGKIGVKILPPLYL